MSSPALAIQLSEAEMRLLQTLVYQECGMYFDARRDAFSARPAAAASARMPHGFLLQLLPPADEPGGQGRN